MIAIVNIGPAPGNRKRGSGSARQQPQDPLGPHLYQVRINERVVTVFTHVRADSLETCLRQAADAVQKARADELRQMVDFVSHYPPQP